MHTPTLTDSVTTLLESPYPDTAEDTRGALTEVGLPPTGAAYAAWGLLKKCVSGDVSAIKLLREITGEVAPKAELLSGSPSCFVNFTDAELEELINRCYETDIK